MPRPIPPCVSRHAWACPFNALYWDFIARTRAIVGGNPRMAQMVRTYDRFSDEERARITAGAATFLAGL